jgi:rhodanese-related sulfurtransferase
VPDPSNHLSITRDELAAELAGTDPPALVEALGPAYFADAHLPGAVNIPPAHVDRLAPLLLPDRERAVVVYCSGAGESSRIVARHLLALGYPQVRVYGAGKEDWAEHGLPMTRP